jgi:hypothetical protein
MYEYPKQRYIDAVFLLGVKSTLAKKAKGIFSFDHRILQVHHDIIAAWFRFKFDSSGQLLLFPDGGVYEKHLSIHWRNFFVNLIRSWTDTSNAFVINCLKAVCYSNTARGYWAENELLSEIGMLCSVDDWINSDWLKVIQQSENGNIGGDKDLPLINDEDISEIIKEYLIKEYLNKEHSPIEKIYREKPEHLMAYGLPSENCFYVICSAYGGVAMLDPPKRVICISTRTGKVVYNGIAVDFA